LSVVEVVEVEHRTTQTTTTTATAKVRIVVLDSTGDFERIIPFTEADRKS
jgi:hypothetical protein